ncbi:hypothetical protein CEUSTIGMA_g9239.t1 [Chlamydomonas eustigma]|uniref:Uncharacterized protein n=1 Tax=Chlamydomonas eustigma TaxID=1157962 RepID=A0A250XFF5_9CHLO|nr:hypothetical protein CEUSTIGMA_g9239.t1 [Chlamydomonas eustigma]|eukprot:GAX81811.1 hypothetical protein CEUSTIGMA_g9239.t1 [Chlamydomonas eustigma]
MMSVYNLLVDSGADPVLQVDALGRSALHFAAAKGAEAIAIALLELGLKPYQLDKQKNTPLHLAAMRGQQHTVEMLLQKSDDTVAALLTPNKEGLCTYHLALKAGHEEKAQNSVLQLMESLGEQFSTPIMLKKGVIKETVLLLAVGSHQDRVVKKLLDMGVDANEPSHSGEVPLSRCFACITEETYDRDAAIFDMLMGAGSAIDVKSQDDHPLLAICKNDLSNFAQRAVAVMAQKGPLDWDHHDSRGYTPLMLAAFHDNAWLVNYLVHTVGISPNDPSQRTKEGPPMVIGSSGSGCCKKPIMSAGTVGNQTPLMCAAKGASVNALKVLLSYGADVHAVDTQGQTALAYALTLDKKETTECAQVLLSYGAKTKIQKQLSGGRERLVDIVDITGESWVHRAVRYGLSAFIESWASYGGSLEVLASTPEDADDMPGAELKAEEKQAFIDSEPTLRDEGAEEEEADEVVGAEEDGGEDSENEAEE